MYEWKYQMVNPTITGWRSPTFSLTFPNQKGQRECTIHWSQAVCSKIWQCTKKINQHSSLWYNFSCKFLLLCHMKICSMCKVHPREAHVKRPRAQRLPYLPLGYSSLQIVPTHVFQIYQSKLDHVQFSVVISVPGCGISKQGKTKGQNSKRAQSGKYLPASVVVFHGMMRMYWARLLPIDEMTANFNHELHRSQLLICR